MASSAASDAAAVMAVDREAVDAGVLLVPEEDIDEDVLSKLLSASRPAPAVVDEAYVQYHWNPPLGIDCRAAL